MIIGVDFHVNTIALHGKKIKLQIWDIGGEERFSFNRPMYYLGSAGAILVFDLTNPFSFELLPQWIHELREKIKPEIPVLLVGNKSDLIDKRAVFRDKIDKFRQEFNLTYIETSAKTGDNVKECFYTLASLMVREGVI